MNIPFLPNSFGPVGRTWYVSQKHPRASDENPGTTQLPLRSITAAGKQINQYDVIVVDEGTYREEVPVRCGGSKHRPQTTPVIRSANDKTASLKGSDTFSPEWTHLEGEIYTAPLPERLFKDEAYNPYKLPLDPDIDECIRPCSGKCRWYIFMVLCQVNILPYGLSLLLVTNPKTSLSRSRWTICLLLVRDGSQGWRLLVFQIQGRRPAGPI